MRPALLFVHKYGYCSCFYMSRLVHSEVLVAVGCLNFIVTSLFAAISVKLAWCPESEESLLHKSTTSNGNKQQHSAIPVPGNPKLVNFYGACDRDDVEAEDDIDDEIGRVVAAFNTPIE